jgi:signal transduction histidine kinase
MVWNGQLWGQLGRAAGLLVLPNGSLSVLLLWVLGLAIGCAVVAVRRQRGLQAELEQRIAARTQQLQASLAELEEMSNLQDLLLYAISHDIRTTMMGCVMVLEQVQEQAIEAGHERSGMISVPRELLQRMTRSGRTQLERVNLLLETHADALDGRVIQPQRLRLRAVAMEAIEGLQPLLEDNQVLMMNQIAADLWVIADPMALRQVFEQLIANTARHNPPGVDVRLEAGLEQGRLKAIVVDNGVGINPLEIPQIFSLRLKPEQERQLTRISLGLCLCQQIIAAHGGEIGLNSELGKGTQVWFTLPVG